MTIEERLEIIANEHWEQGSVREGYTRYIDGVDMEDKINEAFAASDIEQYQVWNTGFDCGPGLDVGVISVSWVDENGKLNMELYDWEVC